MAKPGASMSSREYQRPGESSYQAGKKAEGKTARH